MLISFMLDQGDPSGSLLGVPPDWWLDAVFWLALGLFLATSAAAAGVWTLVARLKELRADARSLEVLEELKQRLDRLVAERGDLDLRRLEHLLIDLRDGSRRVEEALLRVHEARPVESEALVPLATAGLGERVVNRLLALGYEKIELVTRAGELGELAGDEAEVLVEARREGMLHKGRVRVRGGRIEGVEIQPAYPIFP